MIRRARGVCLKHSGGQQAARHGKRPHSLGCYARPVQLSQIILFVHDTARMQAFYDALGMVVVDGSAVDGFVRLRDPAGGAVLALHFTRAVGPPTGPRTDTAIKPCFHVADIEAARASIEAHGATMREVKRFDGIAICDGVDPEGNIFQLTTR